MKYPDKVLLRLEAGTLARIDAVTDNRSEWLRAAIDAALRGKPNRKPVPEPARKAKAAGDPLYDAILAEVRTGNWTSAALERKLGWLGLTYQKAERRLLKSGRLRIEQGILRAD